MCIRDSAKTLERKLEKVGVAKEMIDLIIGMVTTDDNSRLSCQQVRVIETCVALTYYYIVC